MQTEQLTALITSLAPNQKAGFSKQYPEFILAANDLHDVAMKLKSNTETKMDYLFCLTAVDRKDGFHVVYHLTSSEFNHSIILRTIISDKTNPSTPTVSDVWRAAEYYEREVFDMFGIRFENHSDLRRIFLDDDWVGYPLRKDYKDNFTLVR
jgi:NADH-quinone oxidoreductase subunit C